MSKEPLNSGHRRRLKQKFLNSPGAFFQDYEILEMLLFYIYPRQDTKNIAKRLLQENGSLKKLYLQDLDSLSKGAKFTEGLKLQIKLLNELFIRITKDSGALEDSHVFENWDSVLSYLTIEIGHKNREFFKALYLNRRNILIGEQLFDSGTVDRVTVYPREIVKGAIKHDASAVIVAHNHPSGKATPSNQDIKITNLIKSALEVVNIVLHDHVIVANDNSFSFRNQGLL